MSPHLLEAASSGVKAGEMAAYVTGRAPFYCLFDVSPSSMETRYQSGFPANDQGVAELRGINAGPRKVSTVPTKQQGMPGGPLHSSRYRSGPVLN